MNLYDLLMNAKIIDVHVHDEPTKSDINLQFPKPFIPDIVCHPGHIVRCSKVDSKRYVFVCSVCGKTTYDGEDPYYIYNKELIEKNSKDLICPLLIISPEIDKEIEKYENEFSEKIFGYKIHPNFSEFLVSEMTISTRKPIIVHCEVGQYDNVNVILDFAERHDGPIIIAHMGRFSKSGFDRARNMKNVYFDCSSIGLIWDSYNKDSYHLCDTSYLGAFDSPDRLLSLSMQYVGEDKVLFGSDEPYGCWDRDVMIVERLNNRLKDRLLSGNFKKMMKEYGYV